MKKTAIILLMSLMLVYSNLSYVFSAGKVNLNTATVAELMTLPYIGEDTAKNILEYREKNKGFKNIEELKAIKSIGKKKFENLKDLVTVNNDVNQNK